MKNWIMRWIASALALFIICQIPEVGVKLLDKGVTGITTLVLATVAIGLANALIRPIIMFFAWPVNCLTFGLFGLVLNAVLFWIVGSGFVPGFMVTGPVSALIGSVAMSVISGLINFFLKDRGDRD